MPNGTSLTTTTAQASTVPLEPFRTEEVAPVGDLSLNDQVPYKDHSPGNGNHYCPVCRFRVIERGMPCVCTRASMAASPIRILPPLTDAAKVNLSIGTRLLEWCQFGLNVVAQAGDSGDVRISGVSITLVQASLRLGQTTLFVQAGRDGTVSLSRQMGLDLNPFLDDEMNPNRPSPRLFLRTLFPPMWQYALPPGSDFMEGEFRGSGVEYIVRAAAQWECRVIVLYRPYDRSAPEDELFGFTALHRLGTQNQIKIIVFRAERADSTLSLPKVRKDPQSMLLAATVKSLPVGVKVGGLLLRSDQPYFVDGSYAS